MCGRRLRPKIGPWQTISPVAPEAGMRPALLDINVLLALAWPAHIHHEAAHRWFATHRRKGWATCPHTQAGFLRLSMQPAVVKTAISFGDALRVLTSSMSAPEHQFWPQDYSVREI